MGQSITGLADVDVESTMQGLLDREVRDEVLKAEGIWVMRSDIHHCHFELLSARCKSVAPLPHIFGLIHVGSKFL